MVCHELAAVNWPQLVLENDDDDDAGSPIAPGSVKLSRPLVTREAASAA